MSIRRSVTPDHIISLEDGKPNKTLKRHLAGRGLTPEEYRPSGACRGTIDGVAANYASQRSELAKNAGLGQSRARAAAARSLATLRSTTSRSGGVGPARASRKHKAFCLCRSRISIPGAAQVAY